MQREAFASRCAHVDDIDPERIVAAASVLSAIYNLFSQDIAALQVIVGLANGLTAPEIRKANAMSQVDYDSTRRRMRRALLRQRLVGGEP
jgi:RNA polymerase sigma-70 factor (ECF subfamily)